METFGAAGSLIVGIGFILFAIISILAPIWLYLINVYTRQTRDEVKKVNKNLEALHTLLSKQTAITTQAAETPQLTAGKVTCSNCEKEVPYPAKYAGQVKSCPHCKISLKLG